MNWSTRTSHSGPSEPWTPWSRAECSLGASSTAAPDSTPRYARDTRANGLGVDAASRAAPVVNPTHPPRFCTGTRISCGTASCMLLAALHTATWAHGYR
jgi:hypothetical protein